VLVSLLAAMLAVQQPTPLALNCDLAHHPQNIESPPLKESEREATLGPQLQSRLVQLVPPLCGLQTHATFSCDHFDPIYHILKIFV
jgi:hypothetical protein